MSISETSIVNMSLARIGATRINDFDTPDAGSSVNARHCKTHYEQTRDALLRSFEWSFATKRVALSVETATPAYGYDYQFALPADYLRMISSDILDDNDDTKDIFKLENGKFLTDESAVYIKYIYKVTDPAKFDPLFTEVLVLQLAMKLVMPIAQDKVLRREIFDELNFLMSRARTICKQEQNTTGRSDWNLERFS